MIKTHTPLDGLPYFENVAYVHCGRDPRDAFLSMMDHMQNASDAFKTAVRQRAGLPSESWFPTDPNTCFPVWMTAPIHAWMEDGFPTGSVFHAARLAWAHRGIANLHLLHYRDLRLDPGEPEMRRLAHFLDAAVAPTNGRRWSRPPPSPGWRRPRRRYRPWRTPRRLVQQRRLLRQRPARRLARRVERGQPGALPGTRAKARRPGPAGSWLSRVARQAADPETSVIQPNEKGAAAAAFPSISAMAAPRISCRLRTGRRRPGRRRCTWSRRRSARCRDAGLPEGCGRSAARLSCRTGGRWRSSRR